MKDVLPLAPLFFFFAFSKLASLGETVFPQRGHRCQNNKNRQNKTRESTQLILYWRNARETTTDSRRTQDTRTPHFWGWVHETRLRNTISIINFYYNPKQGLPISEGETVIVYGEPIPVDLEEQTILVYLPWPSHKPQEIFPERSSTGVEKMAEKKKSERRVEDKGDQRKVGMLGRASYIEWMHSKWYTECITLDHACVWSTTSRFPPGGELPHVWYFFRHLWKMIRLWCGAMKDRQVRSHGKVRGSIPVVQQ